MLVSHLVFHGGETCFGESCDETCFGESGGETFAVCESDDATWIAAETSIGAESDGDMNRLVQQFAWSANDLADFYLAVGYACLGALAISYGYAVYRLRRGPT